MLYGQPVFKVTATKLIKPSATFDAGERRCVAVVCSVLPPYVHCINCIQHVTVACCPVCNLCSVMQNPQCTCAMLGLLLSGILCGSDLLTATVPLQAAGVPH